MLKYQRIELKLLNKGAFMKEQEWDLSALFENKESAEEFLKTLQTEVQEFENAYQNNLKNLDIASLPTLLNITKICQKRFLKR